MIEVVFVLWTPLKHICGALNYEEHLVTNLALSDCKVPFLDKFILETLLDECIVIVGAISGFHQR